MKNYSPERLDLENDTNKSRIAAHFYRYRLAKDILEKNNRSIKILDIASGTGYGSELLSKIPKSEVNGVDIDEEAVSTSRHRYKKNNLTFTLGSLEKIPFKDNYFNAVVCFETIEHIEEKSTNKALAEINRVLRLGGKLIISTPNKLVEDMAKIFFKIDNQFHSNELTYNDLRTGLTNNNFEIIQEYGQAPIFLPVYPLVNLGLFPNWYFKPAKNIPPNLSMFMIAECLKER